MERGTHLGLAGMLAMLAIAACGATPTPTPPLTQTAAPSGHATPELPATAVPSVAWVGREIATTGLPAIASDGTTIVVAHRDSDGGRGNPNVTLIEKDRDDRVVRRLTVITATDVDQLAPAQIDERFERAAAWLRERHAAQHLVAMAALAVARPTDDAPVPAVGAGAILRWTPNQLVIERERGAAIRRTTPASWLAPDHPLCRTCSEICHNEAFLGGGYVDLQRSVAIVVVAYRGTDTCWEPSSEEHVVVW